MIRRFCDWCRSQDEDPLSIAILIVGTAAVTLVAVFAVIDLLEVATR
jgi:hypothetical protein